MIQLTAAAYLVAQSVWAMPEEQPSLVANAGMASTRVAANVEPASKRVAANVETASKRAAPNAETATASKRAAPNVVGWPSVRLVALSLVPSPLLVLGSEGAGFGLRWQLTPFAYSFGITERRMRYFLVSPVARHVGALELYLSPEWTCCVRPSESGWLARLGTRLYLPAVGRGEVLAVSLGGSYTYENRQHGGAAELGIYTFSSIVGLTLTVAPWLAAREAILALSLRYY